MLSLLTLPAYGQNLLDALEQNQASLPADPGTSEARPSPGITSPTTRPSEVDTHCDEDKQTSLPLKYLTALLLQRDAKLDLSHDPSTGTLRVSSTAKMIGNCNSMLDWKVQENEVDGVKTYAVEVKFKDGDTCPEGVADGDKKCYRFALMKDNTFDKFETKPFSNDIRGFQKCLEASGVVAPDGKINSAAIFKQPLQESFSGLEETGKILFLSHGPVSSQVDPRFALDRVNKCDVYERIHPDISMVYSSGDLRNQRLEAEAAELRNCTPNEYQRLVDFIERNNYERDLGAIRDNLIQQAAQATAKKISENKELTDDDLRVVSDFEHYIIDPLRIEIAQLYNEMENMSPSEQQQARQLLDEKRKKLEEYARAPYFQKAHVEKLLSKGMFADAERMEGIRIAITETAKIGKREGNVTITPDMARVRIANLRGELSNSIVTERENYDIRTGVTTGMSQSYKDLAAAMRRNIQTRTQNYMQEIQSEYARMQQGGYCYKYFRNTQKCIQDSLQRIQELQTALTHYNNIDQQRANEFDEKAKQYGTMEAEGRRYVAAQNGEPVPQEQPQDNTVPQPRNDQNAQAAAAAQMMPQMMMQNQPYMNSMMMGQQMNPYASMYGQSGGLMGQAGFNAGFGYQGTMGQNYMGMAQPQYGSVGMNWFQMGQQMMGGQQQMYSPYGQMGMQSPMGMMYGQSPYMQQPMGMYGSMPQMYNYPRFF